MGSSMVESETQKNSGPAEYEKSTKGLTKRMPSKGASQNPSETSAAPGGGNDVKR